MFPNKEADLLDAYCQELRRDKYASPPVRLDPGLAEVARYVQEYGYEFWPEPSAEMVAALDAKVARSIATTVRGRQPRVPTPRASIMPVFAPHFLVLSVAITTLLLCAYFISNSLPPTSPTNLYPPPTSPPTNLQPDPSQVFKIGVELPLSGTGGDSGIPVRNGVQLAIEEANKAGGVTIGGKLYTFKMYDLDDAPTGEHDPEEGLKNAQLLVDDPQVIAVVGPFNSDVAEKMMPILHDAGLAQISPSNTVVTLTHLLPTSTNTYFRLCATDSIQGHAAADFIFEHLKFKDSNSENKPVRSIYILDDMQVYGVGIADTVERRFKELGGIVKGRYSVPPGIRDFTTILTNQVKPTNPDAIFYGGVVDKGLALARKQMVDLGLNIPFVGSDGIKDSGFLTSTGEAANGSYATMVARRIENRPEAQPFLDSYKKRFGEDAQPYSANGYDAANIIIEAVKEAGKSGKPTRATVRDLIAKTRYEGITGTTEFYENGDTKNKWISIYKAEYRAGTGRWVFVDEFQYAP
jgi:branched-chain amino acid transport system substrate-binding protein